MPRKIYGDDVIKKKTERMVAEFRKGTHMHSARQMACDIWLMATTEQWIGAILHAERLGVDIVTGMGNRPKDLKEIPCP